MDDRLDEPKEPTLWCAGLPFVSRTHEARRTATGLFDLLNAFERELLLGKPSRR